MRLQYSTFIMPHIGDLYSQCADRYAVSKDSPCFAIADGVGASFFPEVWAEIVSKDFIFHSELFENDTILVREKQLIESWNAKVSEKISVLTPEEKFLVEMSRERCDFAACTFVGLTIDNKRWHCKALGDSYLFVLDEDCNIIQSVASQKGHDFDNFPEYFASAHGKNNGAIVSESGEIGNVTYFLLLTDAISDWFIKEGNEKHKKLVEVKDLQDFQSFISAERDLCMKDDDTTAVIIKVIHDNAESISVEEIINTDIDKLISEESSLANEREDASVEQSEEGSNNKAQLQQELPVINHNTLSDATLYSINAPTSAVIKNDSQGSNDSEALLIDKLSRFLQTTDAEALSIKKESSMQNDSPKSNVWKNIGKGLKNLSKQIADITRNLRKIQK